MYEIHQLDWVRPIRSRIVDTPEASRGLNHPLLPSQKLLYQSSQNVVYAFYQVFCTHYSYIFKIVICIIIFFFMFFKIDFKYTKDTEFECDNDNDNEIILFRHKNRNNT